MSDISKLTERTIGGLRIEPVAEKQDFINILIYGDSGIGKTTLAGSAIEADNLGPVLFIDVEGGTLSIKRKYPGVESIRVKTWDELQSVYDELYNGRTGYQTAVLDSVTEIQKMGMNDIMNDVVKTTPSRDRDVPAEREWGKSLEQMRKFLRAFRDLPMNTIFTALAMEVQEKNGAKKIKPSLTGKAQNELPGFLDEVFYLYLAETDKNSGTYERRLLTSSTDKIVAKDRSTNLPQVVINPTMKSLYDTITGDK